MPTSRIAAGGMAEVWRGEGVFEDGGRHPVAIKRVLPALANDPLFRSMFEDEARLGMALRHPNIARVYDGREVGGTFIMIMELVDGTSLKRLLDGAHERGAPMPVASALYVTWKVAMALHYAHAAVDRDGAPMGIIHRDVSPHNVLLGRDGAVKLGDFGLADASVHSNHLDDGMFGGKVAYLAPEVVLRRRGSHKVDVFGLGIVLWEMLAGRRLFERDSDEATLAAVGRCDPPGIRSLNPKVPEEVASLLGRMLARRPEERFDAAECAAHLELAIERADPDVSARDIGLLVGLHLATRRRRGAPLDREMAQLLSRELDVFAGEDFDMGAEPLDPDSFLG